MPTFTRTAAKASAWVTILLGVLLFLLHSNYETTPSTDPVHKSHTKEAHAQHGGSHHKRHSHSRLRRPKIEEVELDDIQQSNHSLLMRRDDYSCGPGNPCANGACCGETGYCGYGEPFRYTIVTSAANTIHSGDTYCGLGCLSNCNAKAECGQNAVPAGKECPLNTWYTAHHP